MKEVIILVSKITLGLALGAIIVGYAVFGDQIKEKTETQLNTWMTTSQGAVN